jgi:hypothetical protein
MCESSSFCAAIVAICSSGSSTFSALNAINRSHFITSPAE